MRKFVIVIFVIICTIFLTGCSKDRVIKTFDDASKKFGDEILTKDNNLIGKRKFWHRSLYWNLCVKLRKI